NKLICVIKVGDFTETEHVERELVLIKVRADERTRGELANIVDIFRAKIIDVSRESYVVEITGAEEKVNALVELLKPLGILEIVRTGKVAMYRGTRVLTVDGKQKERAAWTSTTTETQTSAPFGARRSRSTVYASRSYT